MVLYVVSHEAQEKEVTRHCFGDCGRIKIGAVVIEGRYFLPCRVLECPYSFLEADLGTGEVGNGEERIIVRKLREERG